MKGNFNAIRYVSDKLCYLFMNFLLQQSWQSRVASCALVMDPMNERAAKISALSPKKETVLTPSLHSFWLCIRKVSAFCKEHRALLQSTN